MTNLKATAQSNRCMCLCVCVSVYTVYNMRVYIFPSFSRIRITKMNRKREENYKWLSHCTPPMERDPVMKNDVKSRHFHIILKWTRLNWTGHIWPLLFFLHYYFTIAPLIGRCFKWKHKKNMNIMKYNAINCNEKRGNKEQKSKWILIHPLFYHRFHFSLLNRSFAQIHWIPFRIRPTFMSFIVFCSHFLYFFMAPKMVPMESVNYSKW